MGVALPDTNSEAYAEILTVEVWLRRIASLATAVVGGKTLGALPGELVSDLKARANAARKSEYLGIAEPSTLLHFTTLEELRILLTEDPLFPVVRRMTGFERQVLSAKIDEIREIRNAVGHNRLLSPKTLKILGAAAVSLESGIERVRGMIACGARARDPGNAGVDDELQIVVDRVIRESNAGLVDLHRFRLSGFHGLVAAALLPRHQVLGTEPAIYNELRSVGEWIDVEKLRKCLAGVSGSYIAVVVDEDATGFEVLWSRKLDTELQELLIRSIVGCMDQVWGDEAIEAQVESIVRFDDIWLSGFSSVTVS